MRERLNEDIKAALLAGDAARVESLRFIKSAIDAAEKAKGSELSDQEQVAILRKEVKKREEAAVLFDKGGNAEMAIKEKSEAELIRAYLPPELPEEDIRAKLEELVVENNLPKETASMGRLMGLARAEFGDSVDSSTVAKLAKQILEPK